MYRIIAAILCLLWSACYVNCVVDLAGKLGAAESGSCCGGTGPCQSEPPADTTCTFCEALLHGGLWTFQATGFATLLALALLLVAMAAWDTRWIEAVLASVDPRRSRDLVPRPPDRRGPWTMILPWTAPVRGPSSFAALELA